MNADAKTLIVGIIAVGIVAWLVTHAGPAAQVIGASSSGFATAAKAFQPPATS